MERPSAGLPDRAGMVTPAHSLSHAPGCCGSRMAGIPLPAEAWGKGSDPGWLHGPSPALGQDSAWEKGQHCGGQAGLRALGPGLLESQCSSCHPQLQSCEKGQQPCLARTGQTARQVDTGCLSAFCSGLGPGPRLGAGEADGAGWGPGAAGRGSSPRPQAQLHISQPRSSCPVVSRLLHPAHPLPPLSGSLLGVSGTCCPDANRTKTIFMPKAVVTLIALRDIKLARKQI